MNAPARPPCPSKGKRRFHDQAEAEASLSTIWKRGSRDGPGTLPCRAYLCVCGYWHLTSKAFDPRYPGRGEVLSYSPVPTTNPTR